MIIDGNERGAVRTESDAVDSTGMTGDGRFLCGFCNIPKPDAAVPTSACQGDFIRTEREAYDLCRVTGK